jgi:hypothetical protein
METLLKFFPFIPAEKDSGKLILAIVFYFFVIPTVNVILGALLGLTIILMPLAFVTGFFFGIYGMLGLVLSIVGYMGKLK